MTKTNVRYIAIPAILLLGVVFQSCSGSKSVVSNSPADYVNPFIGAACNPEGADRHHGLGKTFPGATTPYGMVQVSPNTISGKDKSSGYSYENKTIEGFALTQMSGVGWFGDMGNFLVMPTTGKLQTIAGKEDGSITGWRSAFNKETETAEPGYYSVELTDYDIRTETSAMTHCGIMRFTFPENEQSRIQIDLARRVAGSSTRQYLQVVDENTIRGWMECTPEGGGWGNGNGQVKYTLHFYGQFSKPLKDYGFWSADIPDDWARKRDEVTSIPYLTRVAQASVIEGKSEMEGKHLGFFTEFASVKGEQVTLKVGISYVDAEGAENNFNSEIADKDFDMVRKLAWQQWNNELGRVKIEGGTDDQKTVFYTSLYHTMIDPRIYTDVDGRYIGGDYRIHKTDGKFTKRTIFSGWDVYRSQMPLQTIINPTLVNDLLNSLITMADQSGREYYERWEIFNAYSGCMIGNPTHSVLADAYVKGIRNYDAEKAFRYALNTSAKFGNDKLGYSYDGRSRGISLTLEYAYFDWCISQMARAMGKTPEAEEFLQKSGAYKNLWDDEMGWFRQRLANGEWDSMKPKGRLQQGWGCTESNPYQQGWFVPHDVQGMVELMGGREAVLADLTNLFEKAPDDLRWNDYYNHANEPVHLAPFLFNSLGTPWNTQKWTRHICENGYLNDTEGLVGNEDAGQMSAWYVLASCGIHPPCPGSTRIDITSPVFDRAEFRLDPAYTQGGTFTVVAHDNGPGKVYIQRALLNGAEYNKCYIDFADIAAGSTLELFMGNTPNENWGTEL